MASNCNSISSALSLGLVFRGGSLEVRRFLILQKSCFRNIYNSNVTETCKEKLEQSYFNPAATCILVSFDISQRKSRSFFIILEAPCSQYKVETQELCLKYFFYKIPLELRSFEIITHFSKDIDLN